MSKTFEEKSFILKLSKNMDAVAWTKPNDRCYAYQYALWAYHEGIAAAVEVLRSDAAQLKAKDCYRNGHCPDGNDFGDWIEEQFKRDGVIK